MTSKSALTARLLCVALGCAGVLSAHSVLAQQDPLVQGFVSLGAGGSWPSDLTLVGKVADGVDEARFISIYPAGTKSLVDINGGILVHRHLVVGMGLSRSAARQAGTLTVELSHPEFHPTLTASADTAPLERTQMTWHWSAGYQFDVGSHVKVMLVGGPSRVQVTQRLIDDLDFEESIDFRTGQWYIVGPAYAADTLLDTAAWGYHVASDFTYRISPRIGLGALARYTRATIDYDNPIQGLIDDRSVTTRAVTSGVELSGGLRLALAPSSGTSARPAVWEIEGHAGTGWGMTSTGKGSVPMVGVAFTTFNGRPSRTVPSWYLKEGADRFNDNAASRGDAVRMTPLDPALDPSTVTLPRHAPFGMRLARKIGGRYAAEFTLDISNGGFELTENARNRVAQAREGFERGFRSLLINQTNPVVSSSATLTESSGRQVLTVGALKINLLRGRRLTPYATAGGGLLSRRGALPAVSLSGGYTFTSGNQGYDQLDLVDVEFIDSTQPRITSSDDGEECPWEGCAAAMWSYSAVAALGGGLTYDLSSRLGLRVDARAYLQRDPVRVMLHALPLTFSGSLPISFDGPPAIQVGTRGQSTLSARFSEDEIEVARSDGIRALFALTGGIFWRF